MTTSFSTALGSTACLGVIVPVYNEARWLDAILERVLARPEVAQVVAVDDGSSDDSWAKLLAWQARDRRVAAIQHPANRGKGAAIRTALECLGTPLALIQDPGRGSGIRPGRLSPVAGSDRTRGSGRGLWFAICRRQQRESSMPHGRQPVADVGLQLADGVAPDGRGHLLQTVQTRTAPATEPGGKRFRLLP
jgi:hypothetical protein